MHKVTNVSVLSNIVRMGAADGTRAYSTLRRWRRIQNLTKRVLQQFSTRELRWAGDAALPKQVGDHLFMSFHYGLWYLSLAAMAQATGCHRVYCLVGEIHPSYNDRMAAMARAAGIEIVLVPGGVAMLRGVRKARAEGALIFVLIDVPWGLSGEPDRRFPFFGGHIEAKSALFTFAERAGLQPHLLVADYDEVERSTFVRSHAVQSQAECFELLQRYVAEKPWLWERLVDVHKFSSLTGERPHLPFKVANDFYVANMANLKVARINRTLYERMLEAKRLALQGLAADAASLLDQIHASTTLAVRSVF